MSNKEHFIQQAHHIIPVEALKSYERDIQRLFGLGDIKDFQQMGSNFIYLYSETGGKHEYADRAKELLQENKHIFGDVPVGGVNHSGGHANYNNAVTEMLGEIFEQEKNPDKQKMMILDLQRGLKQMLIEGKPTSILQNTEDDDVKQDIIDTLKERIYHPNTPNDLKNAHEKSAQEYMKKFVDEHGKFIYDDGKFENRVFDGGTGDGNRSTNELAKYTAEKIYEPIRKLNEKIGFLSEQSIKKFKNYTETDPDKFEVIDDKTGGGYSETSRARQVIFSVTYDIERFMAGRNVLDDINPSQELRERIDRFYDDFARAVQLSTSYDANPADINKMLTDLASRQDDIKMAQMLRDLNNNKSITIDVDNDSNHGNKTDFKGSKTAQLIDDIGRSGKFDNAKINGIKVSEYQKSAGGFGKWALSDFVHQGVTDKSFFNKLMANSVESRVSQALNSASKVMNFEGFAKEGRKVIFETQMFKAMMSDETMVQFGIGAKDAYGIRQLDPQIHKVITNIIQGAQGFNASAPSFVADGVDFVNTMYDVTIEGISTGNWDNFKDKLGETAIDFAIDVAVGFAVGVGFAMMATASIPAVAIAGQVAMVAFIAYGVKMAIDSTVELAGKIAQTDFKQLWEDFRANHEIDDKFYEGYDAIKDYFNDMAKWAKSFFNRTGEYHVYDPLVLDLEGDGIDTIAPNGFKTLFDGDADGIATATSWVSGGEGILALDLNHNGVIDDGGELFGDGSKLLGGGLAKHGYEALMAYDTNQDGLIDTSDEVFESLKVWQDQNSDGMSQADEIFTLMELGIESLSVTYADEAARLQHATIAQKSSFIKDGKEHLMADLVFTHNPLYAKHKDIQELTDEQKQLPTIKGLGRVHDLHQALARSKELQVLVGQYKMADTKEAQLNLLPKMIEAWAKTDAQFMTKREKGVYFDKPTVQTTDMGVALTPSQKNHLVNFNIADEATARLQALATKIAILDSFSGQNTQTIYVTSQQEIDKVLTTIEEIYANLEVNLYNLLLSQTRLKPYLQEIVVRIDGDKFEMNHDGLTQKIITKYETDPKNAFIDLAELLVLINPKGWMQGTSLLQQFADEARQMGHLADWVAQLHDQTIDKLSTQMGSEGSDTLTAVGLLDKDVLDGRAGDDVLVAGRAISVLTGGAGDDIYQYHQGFGASTIHNHDGNANRYDVIELKFASKSDISYARQGDDLVVGVKGEANTIIIKDMFYGDVFTHHIDKIVLKDGEITLKDITTKLLTGTRGDDVLIGFGGHDVIHAGVGDDVIEGRGGNDIIHTGFGNDRVDAGSGHDVIYLGVGNNYAYGGDDNDIIYSSIFGHDKLEGGMGSDTYVFGRNFGKDEIVNFNPNGQDKDVIRLTQGINLNHLNITRQDNHLIINQKHTANTIKVTDFFDKDALGDWAITQITGSDGKSINVEQIKQLVTQGTSHHDVLYAYSTGTTLNGKMGHDTLVGNSGQDTLLGGKGHDVLIGGQGDDILAGGSGHDTYVYKKGDGNDIIQDTGGHDTLKILGLTLSDLVFEKKADDLNVLIKADNEFINIQGYFSSLSSCGCFGMLSPLSYGNTIEHIQVGDYHLGIKEIYGLAVNKHEHII